MLEVKAILHEMLRNYQWSVPPDYEVRWDNTALPVSVDGLPIRFQELRQPVGGAPTGRGWQS